MNLILHVRDSFEKDPAFILTVALVVLLHALFMTAAIMQPEKQHEKPVQNLFVTTLTLKKEPEAIIEDKSIVQTEALKPAPPIERTPKKVEIKKDEPKVKKELKKNVKKAPEKEKPKEKVQSVEKIEKRKELFKQAKKTLDKISTNSHEQKEASQVIPNRKTIGELNAEKMVFSNLSKELSYKDEVALILKRELQLPEMGDVEIKLQITNQGDFLQLEIVKSKSELNSSFVKLSIPKIKFPPSKNESKNVTLLFTLTNE